MQMKLFNSNLIKPFIGNCFTVWGLTDLRLKPVKVMLKT